MTEVSIHDHHITKLVVDVAARTIELRTISPYAEVSEVARVTFGGVAGYVFVGEAFGTILFDIEPEDPVTLYREHEITMRANTNGGSPAWASSEQAAAALFTANGISGFRITSSIGLEGAVWAREMRIRAEHQQES